jgi:hypothetical protein
MVHDDLSSSGPASLDQPRHKRLTNNFHFGSCTWFLGNGIEVFEHEIHQCPTGVKKQIAVQDSDFIEQALCGGQLLA